MIDCGDAGGVAVFDHGRICKRDAIVVGCRIFGSVMSRIAGNLLFATRGGSVSLECAKQDDKNTSPSAVSGA